MQILPTILINSGSVPAVPLGNQFKYLGRLYDFSLDDSSPNTEILSKFESFLKIISDLAISPQTKIRIFSVYLPSQIMFHLKIYNFSLTWISETLDALCCRFVRRWVEAPISSCIKEWLVAPQKLFGMGVPSFRNRVENLKLGKRNALKNSKNENIRALWKESTNYNINSDSIILEVPFKQALKQQISQQLKDAPSHFLGLKVQGLIARTVTDILPSSQISNWVKSLNFIPGYLFNFTRKAIQFSCLL